MKGPAGMPRQPGDDLGMLVAAVVVEDHVDHLAGRYGGLDGAQEAQELLVPVALHATAEDRAVEDVESSEQGGDAVAEIIVGHGAGLAWFDRQTGLGPIQGLNLAFLIDREHQAVRRRLDVQADDVLELGGKLGIVERLKVRMRWGCNRCTAQIRCTERREIAAVLAMARPVQWVASPGDSVQVSATTRCTVASSRRGLPGLRVASRSRPSTPASAKRRCQRQTAGRPTAARRAISATVSRSAEPRTIRARATCFWARLRSATIASKRARSVAETQGQTTCAIQPISHICRPM